MRYITSQHYLNDDIVAEKSASCDYVVDYITVEIDGEEYRIVVDGNHSLAAALADNASPVFEHDESVQAEYADMTAEEVLERCWMDGDYIDAITRDTIW